MRGARRPDCGIRAFARAALAFASLPWLATPVPLLAQAVEPAPDDAPAALVDLLSPLPPIPEATRLPPIELGEPIDLPAVQPIEPALVAPLPPLGTFDPTPSVDFNFAEVAQEGVRYRVAVEGLDGTGLEPTFRRLSALVRGERRPATAAQIASRTNADKALMERLLRSEGWYSGTVTAQVTAAADPDARTEIRLVADPADRYSWRRITLDLIPEDRADLAEGFGLRVGEPVRAIAVEEAEGALLRHLQEQGFPFAEIGARDVVLDQARPLATYLLTGDTGPQGIFGPIRMTGYQPFDEAHAQVIARFRPGQPFDLRLLEDFRRALIATQQFAGVTVTPVDTGLREPDGRAVTELRVVGNRGPHRLLRGQIGWATDEGFRAEASWRHRNLLPPEGQFTARAVAGTQEQRLAAELAKLNFHQRDRTLRFEADLANLTPPAFNASTVQLTAEMFRASTAIWQKRWTWSAGFALGASRERSRALPEPREDLPGFTVTREFLFVTLPFSVGYDRSDDLLDPQKGYRLRLRIEPEGTRERRDFETYVRSYLEGTAYQGLGEGLVLAGRLRLGSIVGADLFDIPPSRRLYAGGGGSVRGFDYQGVGPLGFNNRPIGGRGL
ncbi:MAG: autotransporter assembly complex protein TamA, partial [Sphingomonadaceae bacterium]